jgi:hypothetical protein
MIITDNTIEFDTFSKHPIYLLTGDIETTKFFSILTSSCSKLGYYIEGKIKEYILASGIPQQPSIQHHELWDAPAQYFIHGVKFGAEKPDFVVVDEGKLTIDVYEIKMNLSNVDSKKAHGEKAKYTRLFETLSNDFPEYKVGVYVADFLGTTGGAIKLYEDCDILEVINGETFCTKVGISYKSIMDDIRYSQIANREFIKNYKNKKV